ncbi:PAS domain S-box protein [Phragmitibacter flavus]|uniref:histidine kinase n=1 Tax=Phragmitibacter flavus TaxID=2576071 RepID=A0A5R8KFX7_9BACT|nr:PAS domain S-box protein [Phragmitibacter flavus]TLD71214.1 PAS domain S-box protein [Phragmitibacter flavus]
MNSIDSTTEPSLSGEQHDLLFRLIENAPFGVYLVDADFRLRQVSAGAMKIFEQVRPLIGRDFNEVLRVVWAEPFATEAIKVFRNTLETGEAFETSGSTALRQDLGVMETYQWKIERVAMPDGRLGVACYFANITERQEAQQEAAFLSQLSQKLAMVTDPAEINAMATREVGEFLGLHRCYFFDVLPEGGALKIMPDWRRSGNDLAGVHRMDRLGTEEWREALYRGRIVIDDVRAHEWTRDFADNYEALDIRAYTVAPFLYEGRWVASVKACSDVPRVWKNGDVRLLENVVARVWPLIERARVEEELRVSEERFRTLFESIDEGFCVIEVLFDGEGRPVDYRFEQANPAFEEFTGLRGVLGRTALELVPDLEPFWVETYGRVAMSGMAVRFEQEAKPMNRWFEVHASRIGGSGSRRVAIVFNNITHRKQVETALGQLTRESDQQRRLYETVLSNTPDLVYVWGLDHRFTYANEALLKMWGRSRGDAIGKHCLELGYEPWHAEMHDREIDHVVATKHSVRGEVPFVHETDGLRDYDYILVPVLGDDGEVVAVAGTTRDVTERKRSEKAVQLRTAQFETLLNQAPLGVYLVDDALRVAQANPLSKTMFGDVPEVIGQELDGLLRRLWPTEMVDDVMGIFRRTLETGEAYASPERGERRLDTGEREFYAWRTDRITLPDGRHGVVCYFMDISAQVETRERIQESEERLRTLVSVIADVVWMADAEGAFADPQPAWEAFTGQSWEAHRGLGWFDAIHPEDRDEFALRWRQAREQGGVFESPGRLWHADSGEWRHFVARATPLRESDGSVREWVGACTDVSVQKRTEAELRVARDQAERVSRAKDHFLAVLSHELRTPLTPVLMAVAALEHDPGISVTVREDLAMMKRNIELETKLIDDLLDLSRITTGKLVLKVETVDLHQAVKHVCGICRPQARERGVILRFQEVVDEPMFVSTDAARLQQVLWNVVRNGIKFTPEGGTVEVTVSKLSASTDRYEVRVRDSGIGIPAKALPHIFDAFEQGGADVTRQFGGLGLGLAICESVMTLNGGSIRAESEGEGQGSTFIIEVPMAQAPTKGGGSVEVPEEDHGHARLLLVEDHADTLRMLSRMLKKAGYRVMAVSNVGSALAAVESNAFDLVVSDLGLPDGNGYELMRRIQAVKPLPGIAMSGFGMEEDMRRSREAGFSEHLVKPIDVGKLVAAIQRVSESGREGESRMEA